MKTEFRKRDMRKPFRIRLSRLRAVVRFVLLAGGCPAQSRKTWGQWGLWVLWGQWGALSPANAGREMIVQNRTVVRFVMLAAWAKIRCTWLSKMREMIVQNRTVVWFVMLAAWAKLHYTWLSKMFIYP